MRLLRSPASRLRLHRSRIWFLCLRRPGFALRTTAHPNRFLSRVPVPLLVPLARWSRLRGGYARLTLGEAAQDRVEVRARRAQRDRWLLLAEARDAPPDSRAVCVVPGSEWFLRDERSLPLNQPNSQPRGKA